MYGICAPMDGRLFDCNGRSATANGAGKFSNIFSGLCGKQCTKINNSETKARKVKPFSAKFPQTAHKFLAKSPELC